MISDEHKYTNAYDSSDDSATTYDPRYLPRYLAGTFAIAWALQIPASFFALQGKTVIYQLLLAVSMFSPLAGTLIAGLPLSGMGWIPRLRRKLPYLLLAWFGPALLSALGALLFFIVFPGYLDLSGSYLTAAYGEEMVKLLEQQGLTLQSYVLITAVSAFTFYPLINMLAAVGEETGWRGFLSPQLKARLGRTKGLLLCGVIWGVWHWPVMLLAGYNYGVDYPGAPLLGMLIFCVFTTAFGIFLDFLYERTGCIWIPALAHGALNACAGIPSVLTSPGSTNLTILGPSPIGLLAGIPVILTALALLLRKGK